MAVFDIQDISSAQLHRCRALCNALMQYQAKQSHKHTEILAAMHFENRLKPSFESAQHKKLLLAHCAGKAVGYAYANTYEMEEDGRYFVPDFLQAIYQEGQLVFYPDSQQLPATIGVFNNLYVLPEQQGKGLGRQLSLSIMKWLQQSGASDLYVYVSNGNEEKAVPFYESLGFSYSHSVLDGFITAFHQSNANAAVL